MYLVLALPLVRLACISLQNSPLSGWVCLGYLILLQQTLSVIYGFLASLSLVEVDLEASYPLVSRTLYVSSQSSITGIKPTISLFSI